jgi:hypothetical protein
VDRETIERKLEDLRRQERAAFATLNAVIGAIQFAEALLAEMPPAPSPAE